MTPAVVNSVLITHWIRDFMRVPVRRWIAVRVFAGGVATCCGAVFVLGTVSSRTVSSRTVVAEESARSLGEKLKGAVRTKNYETARALVHQLAETGELDAYRSIVKDSLSGVDYDLEREAGFALASATSGEVHDYVFEQLDENRNFKTRIVLLAVVARWAKEDARALEVLHRSLGDRKKPVVLAALSWVKKLKREESVEPLLDLIEKRLKKVRGRTVQVKDRVYYDSVDALKAITEREFSSVVDWRTYWKAHQEGTALEKKPARKGPSRTAVHRPPSFFDIPVNSDRVLFVIDVSTSMRQTDERAVGEEVAGGELSKGKTRVGGASSGGGARRGEIRVRMRRAQDELIRAVGTLDAGVRFGIVAFSHKMFFWGGDARLVDATLANKKSAESWINGLQATGFTRTDLALGHALGAFDVDTIFLLTDGEPKDRNNQRLAVNPILEYVRIENRFLRSRIHCISFAQIRDTKMRYLVEQLPARNGGRHVYLK